MKTKRRAPTMKDVAAEAGVALGTVSKVFNNIPVGEEYRLRVDAAAQKLGYQVNSYARGLKTNQTNTVALILPVIENPFFSKLCDSVIGALLRRSYRTLVTTTNFDPEAEQRCIEMVRQNKVDGIIALTYSPDLQVDDDLPFVSIDRHFGATIPCVSSDNFGGGQIAAQKLIELGCKKLLFLRRGSHVVGEPDKRGAGFEAYCRQQGAEQFSLDLPDTMGIDLFYAFIDEHLHEGRFDFDGIFCNTDHLALLIRKRLQDQGIRVPEDVQIIGFDGIRTFAMEEYVCSTIAQPVEQLAETAVEALLTKDRSKLQALISLPVKYCPGGTTRDCLPPVPQPKAEAEPPQTDVPAAQPQPEEPQRPRSNFLRASVTRIRRDP